MTDVASGCASVLLKALLQEHIPAGMQLAPVVPCVRYQLELQETLQGSDPMGPVGQRSVGSFCLCLHDVGAASLSPCLPIKQAAEGSPTGTARPNKLIENKMTVFYFVCMSVCVSCSSVHVVGVIRAQRFVTASQTLAHPQAHWHSPMLQCSPCTGCDVGPGLLCVGQKPCGQTSILA